MHPTDQRCIMRLPLKSGNILERVINAGGEHYSCIIENGVEIANTPTDNESEMLQYFHETIRVR